MRIFMIPCGMKSMTRMMNAPEKIGWISGSQMLASSKTAAKIKVPIIGPGMVPIPPKMVIRTGKRAQLRLKNPVGWM